jgi:capsular exopolysaccharide synthesis family protein
MRSRSAWCSVSVSHSASITSTIPVKTPDDISRRLKLKFLGLVPIVSGDRHPLISGPVPHDFGEAYRSIRTALAAQLPGNAPRIVAVASSQPLEGKTTTAVNIAMALAVGGARVLLIDADMRRPSVHKALRMSNDRGLSQLLAGQARMREVVQRTHDPNLLTITAGRTPANPSELLASDRMRALLSGLETGPFDWIIIDTPPVLAVTDAVILAPLVACGDVRDRRGDDAVAPRGARRRDPARQQSAQRARGAEQGELRTQQVLLLALLRPPVQELLRGIPGSLIRAAAAARSSSSPPLTCSSRAAGRGHWLPSWRSRPAPRSSPPGERSQSSDRGARLTSR